MALKYKCYTYTYDGSSDVREIVRVYNNPTLNESIVEKLMVEFEQINEGLLPPRVGRDIQIPVLLPYTLQHERGQFNIQPSENQPKAEQKEEIKKQSIDKPLQPIVGPVKRTSGITKYKTYPYVFCHPGDTIQAVIRLYNDMSLDMKMIEWLVQEFNSINEEALPPKLGQRVEVPVLLPFCYRHENDNRIFDDEEVE